MFSSIVRSYVKQGQGFVRRCYNANIRSKLQNILTRNNKYKGIEGYFGDNVFINIIIVYIRYSKLSRPGMDIFVFGNNRSLFLQVASRRVIQVGACLVLVVGIFGKVGAFIGTIPSPVIGGVLLVVMGTYTTKMVVYVSDH